MSKVDTECRYLKSHEWARKNADGSIIVGISDHAQIALGDLVFVELPAVGSTLNAGASCAVVESVKAASDVYSPMSGVVSSVNSVLADSPETINNDAYGAGWMFTLMPSAAGEFDALLDAKTYEAGLES